jgi:hypothetical protein
MLQGARRCCCHDHRTGKPVLVFLNRPRAQWIPWEGNDPLSHDLLDIRLLRLTRRILTAGIHVEKEDLVETIALTKVSVILVATCPRGDTRAFSRRSRRPRGSARAPEQLLPLPVVLLLPLPPHVLTLSRKRRELLSRRVKSGRAYVVSSFSRVTSKRSKSR